MAKKIENEKVKPLVLHDTETGETFTLEFSRDSVRFAEQRGFGLNSLENTPLTAISDMFFYAFRMHHKNIARERTDRILFEDLGGLPDGALERLVMLYQQPFEAFSTETPEGEGKNAKVTVEL